jgi:hypothetical protein
VGRGVFFDAFAMTILRERSGKAKQEKNVRKIPPLLEISRIFLLYYCQSTKGSASP